MPRHYLNQFWSIVNSKLRNKLQWNLKWKLYIFIQENVFPNVVCETAAILSRPQCVDAEQLTHASWITRLSIQWGWLIIHVLYICFCLISMVSRQKGPTCHAYAWQIGPFWQDTLDMAQCVSPVWCLYLQVNKPCPFPGITQGPDSI